MNKGKLLGTVASFLMAMASLPSAQAQEAAAGATAVSAPVSPWQTCATQNNINLPAKGSGEKLSKADRHTLRSCMRTARKAAFEQCATTAGIAQGQKPTQAQHQEVRQCMKTAGFTKHHRHHHWANS